MVLLHHSGPCLLIFGRIVHYRNRQPAPPKYNQCFDKKLAIIVAVIGFWLHHIRSYVVCRISNFIKKLFSTCMGTQKASTAICLTDNDFSSVTNFSEWEGQIQKLLKRKIPVYISCFWWHHKQTIQRTQIMATVKRKGLIILKGNRNVPGCMKYPPVSWQPHSRRWLANVPCANCMSFQFQPNS